MSRTVGITTKNKKFSTYTLESPKKIIIIKNVFNNFTYKFKMLPVPP